MSQKRKRSSSPGAEAAQESPYYTSQAIEDRKSKFIGFYSPTLSYKELQALSEISSANHKIAAWRRESNQQSLTATKRYVTGSDDDGEKYAGKKVEQALSNALVTGSCVVARWWGGIMLGPARFEHIDTCAREAIQRWKDSIVETAAKKQRIEAEEAERQKLIGALELRDSNISVLRKLATQKERALQDAASGDAKQQADAAPVPVTSSPAVAYAAMPLEKLRALDRVRDATVSFLLRRIDKSEAELLKK